MNLFKIPGICLELFELYKRLQYQKKWIARNLEPILGEFSPDGVLSIEHFKKIRQYALLTVVGVSEALAALRGKLLSEQERFSQTILASVSALFDVMYDEGLLPPADILTLTYYFQLATPKNQLEELFVRLLCLLNNNQPFSLREWKCIQQIAEAQTEEKQHFIISYDIAQRAKKKCGNAILLCAYYLETNWRPEVLSFLYDLGGVYQTMDDILDYYDDFHAQHLTLATIADSFDDLEFIYYDEIEKTKSALKKLPFSVEHKKRFWKTIRIMLATALVLLKKLRSHEKKHKMPLAKYLPRKKLICDMDKIANVLQLILKSSAL
ncbi:MAG: hypothetical protein NZM38_03590 [Cytophagales bacterium]|nr:hypothetical protein [Cytophagales bacterium]MDW8383835.1 hypothetical protein [Flammeovirgaceae bacterium]